MTMLCGTPDLLCFPHHCYNNASLIFIYWSCSLKRGKVARNSHSYSEKSILHFCSSETNEIFLSTSKYILEYYSIASYDLPLPHDIYFILHNSLSSKIMLPSKICLIEPHSMKTMRKWGYHNVSLISALYGRERLVIKPSEIALSVPSRVSPRCAVCMLRGREKSLAPA